MSIAGHVSRAMLSRYSHVRMEAKRRALDEIATRQRDADEKRKKESRAEAGAGGCSHSTGNGSVIKIVAVLEISAPSHTSSKRPALRRNKGIHVRPCLSTSRQPQSSCLLRPRMNRIQDLPAHGPNGLQEWPRTFLQIPLPWVAGDLAMPYR